MGLLKWLFSSKIISHKPRKEAVAYTERKGEMVPVDAAFQAWTSGRLDKMLEAESTKTNPVDRHYLLLGIVDVTYKLRKDREHRQICIKHAEKHIQEFPSLADDLRKSLNGELPRVPTFQNYATILTEGEEYAKAISVCEKAIEYGLHDGTNTGFEGRIDRIKRKAGIAS